MGLGKPLTVGFGWAGLLGFEWSSFEWSGLSGLVGRACWVGLVGLAGSAWVGLLVLLGRAGQVWLVGFAGSGWPDLLGQAGRVCLV